MSLIKPINSYYDKKRRAKTLGESAAYAFNQAVKRSEKKKREKSLEEALDRLEEETYPTGKLLK